MPSRLTDDTEMIHLEGVRLVADLLWYGYIRWLLMRDTARLFDSIYDLDWYRELLESWLTDLHCGVEQRLLEVGCGTGRLSLAAAAQRLRVTAVDGSQAMLEAAHRRIGPGSDIDLSLADVTALPFPDRQFDTVIAASLINIVEDPQAALGEMSRVLRPGGKLAFLVPNEQMNRGNVSDFIRRHGLCGFSAQALRTWGRIPPKLSRQRCLELAEQTGLQQIQLSPRLDAMVFAVSGLKASA